MYSELPSNLFLFFPLRRLIFLCLRAVGMAVMLATIWIRLKQTDSSIFDRLGVHFYSVAFLAIMSVAGVPAFVCFPFFRFIHMLNLDGLLSSRNVPSSSAREAMAYIIQPLMRTSHSPNKEHS